MELISRELTYPAIARRKGWQGVVKLELHIEADGSITGLQVDETSGYSILDKAAHGVPAARQHTRCRTLVAWDKPSTSWYPSNTAWLTADMGNRLSKIYTRTGDDGSTGLGDGSRIAKDSLRIEAMGTVDELNCALGVLLCNPLNESTAVNTRRYPAHPV